MSLAKSTILVFMVLSGAIELKAQWVPVTAKIRKTTELSENGQITSVERREGVFYRSSDGSILTYWTRVNDDEKRGGTGELFDNKNLYRYTVDFKSKHAFQEGEKLAGPLQPKPLDFYKSAPGGPLGDDFGERLRCLRRPHFIVWPDGRREPAGQTCHSVEYDLSLWEDLHSTQNGVTRHVVIQLYDIRLREEPDPKWFDVDSNLKVFRPQPANRTKP